MPPDMRNGRSLDFHKFVRKKNDPEISLITGSSSAANSINIGYQEWSD